MNETGKSRAFGSLAKQPGRSIKRGRSVVAVIGIDQYKHWPRLRNAVNDALGVQARLIEQFGFVEAFRPLINEQATRDALLSAVNDQLRKFVQDDDELLLFFAGHGHTRVSDVGERKVADGYLVPVDAHTGTDERWSEYVAIEPFLVETAKLPARHILVILDACHSGFALGDAMKAFRGDAGRYNDDLAGRLSRKVITSAMHDQLAQDGGPVAGHSLFAGTLIDGLNWGSADLDGNGFVTSSELGLFLQQRVAQASGSSQTPDFGSFHLDDRGELLLSLQNQTFDALKARALACVQAGDFSTFRELVHQIAPLRPSSPEALYLQYRLALHEGDIGAAIACAGRLVSLDLSKGTIPLSEHDLGNLTIVLPFWRRLLEIPEGDLPLRAESLIGGSVDDLSGAGVIGLGEVDACVMESGQVLRLRIANPAETQVHVYVVLIDPDGRLSVPPLWDDDEMLWNGLAPASTQDSFPFAFATLGIWEVRLYASPFRIRYLVSAPATATRAILSEDALSRFDWSRVQMKTLRYGVRPRHLALQAQNPVPSQSRSVLAGEDDPLVALITRVRLELATQGKAARSQEAWERQVRDQLGKNDLVHFVEAPEKADFIVRLNAQASLELIDSSGKTVLRRSPTQPEMRAAQMIRHLSIYRGLRQYRPRAKQLSQQCGLAVELVGRCGPEPDEKRDDDSVRPMLFDPDDSIPTFHSGETVMLRVHNRGNHGLYVGVFLLGADWSVHLLDTLDLAAQRDQSVSIESHPEGRPVENLWLVKVMASRQREPYETFELPPLDEDDFQARTVGLPRAGVEVAELTIREREA